MRLRPYIATNDYHYITQWIDDDRVHALWCANLIPYPITKESFNNLLERNAIEWTDSAYVATEDNGKPIGFFCYSVIVDDNTGFLKFVIVDKEKRGTGCGQQMLHLALQYAFHITGVSLVQLNVFAENTAAKHCYEKVGFHQTMIAENVFPYKNELWSRCHMVIESNPDKLIKNKEP